MTEHIVKPCPRCGQPLEIRRDLDDAAEYVGCSAWPQCRHREALPEAIVMRRQGQRELFEEGPA